MTAPQEATVADVEALTTLRRPRYQRFVVGLANGMTQTDAIRYAGYTTRAARKHGSRLMKKPEIAAALKAVREELARRSAFTLDSAMAQFSEDRKFAYDTKNATAAVRASELMARMTGHLVDKLDARVRQTPVGPGLTVMLVQPDGTPAAHQREPLTIDHTAVGLPPPPLALPAPSEPRALLPGPTHSDPAFSSQRARMYANNFPKKSTPDSLT